MEGRGSEGGGGRTPVATPPGTGTSYTDSAVTNGTTYYYTVAAVNTAGVGGQSGEASATPQAPVTAPGAPPGLSATGGNGQVSLSWTARRRRGGEAVERWGVAGALRERG